MVRVLTITAIVAILSGCASCPVPVTVDKPARPVLIDPPPSLVDAVDAILDAAANHPDRETIAEWESISEHNELALKRYAKQLEARIDAVGQE